MDPPSLRFQWHPNCSYPQPYELGPTPSSKRCPTHTHLPPGSQAGVGRPHSGVQRTGSLQSSTTNRSSLQGSYLDFHNLSQDSGISPSPHFSSSTFLGSFDRGVNITPSPQTHTQVGLTPHVGSWMTPQRQDLIQWTMEEPVPPPLPPRRNSHHWLLGKTDHMALSPRLQNQAYTPPTAYEPRHAMLSHTHSNPEHSVMPPQNSSSWKARLKQRREFERCSTIGSSDSSDEEGGSMVGPAVPQKAIVHRVIEDKPPPPPPRDPRRKILHWNSSTPASPLDGRGRPTSYSFEASPELRTQSSGQVAHARRRSLLQSRSMSNSEHNIAHLPPNHFGDHFDGQPRSRRPVQLPRARRSQGRTDECDDVAFKSQPTLLNLPVLQNPPAEYWKSPPPMNSPSYRMYEKTARLAFSDHSREASPQRPLRKRQVMSESNRSLMRSMGGDSAFQSGSLNVTSSSSIDKCGKSSPSSVSSKDSGCSEPKSLGPINRTPNRPLSALLESHHEPSMQGNKENSPPCREELSPPRSCGQDPGFSTKARRSKFRDALNELEDVITNIQMDQDLLDRAERRDLPTAHQELIVQARERFALPSEENSRLDDESNEMFSDMDNFMNWNTSSSFENLPSLSGSPVPPRRNRTPASRRSGVIDKKTDDMLYRVIRANNRPIPEAASPISKVNYSYLENSKALCPEDSANAISCRPAQLLYGRPEPDLRTDDLLYRVIRNANATNVSDPQPKFGIPRDEVSACSDQDYLHAIPDDGKYRSTFNPMKNPDLVKDDLAFRSLRKDSNPRDPASLGIVKDPNVDHLDHSCWLHKRREEEYKDPVEHEAAPYVFYPKKNQKLLKALSEHIAQTIKKQSHSSSGLGLEGEILTYEDLRDPKILEAVKLSLNIVESEEDKARDEEEKLEWKGKSMFDLLSDNIQELLARKRASKNEARQIEEALDIAEEDQEQPNERARVKEEVLNQEEESKNLMDESPSSVTATLTDHRRPDPETDKSESSRMEVNTENEAKIQMPDVIIQHCTLEHSLENIEACFKEKLALDYPIPGLEQMFPGSQLNTGELPDELTTLSPAQASFPFVIPEAEDKVKPTLDENSHETRNKSQGKSMFAIENTRELEKADERVAKSGLDSSEVELKPINEGEEIETLSEDVEPTSPTRPQTGNLEPAPDGFDDSPCCSNGSDPLLSLLNPNLVAEHPVMTLACFVCFLLLQGLTGVDILALLGPMIALIVTICTFLS